MSRCVGSLFLEGRTTSACYTVAVYVFSNQRRDRIEILMWDRNGLTVGLPRILTHRACGLAANQQCPILPQGRRDFSIMPSPTLTYLR
ncbi:IS66 family insertion sequence element accessory protein TnpB [Paraburkholderia graminis]|uniref:IS66 family insertion sequence element accessory protein TnpB n=1 Tax=Paraburkholderia graminis TaxID=60548 RepID=UPI0038BBBEF3